MPDTAEIKIDPKTNQLLREGVSSIVNPYDSYALEMAMRVKDETPAARITVISMGPRQAEHALRQCLAAGADEAYLLSDPAFAGSDTLATSYILAAAIRCIGPFDLILCGRQAIDGDTAQTGPALAEFLDIPQITFAKKININKGAVLAVRETEHGTETWRASLPALVTITKPEFEPRSPTLSAKLAAKRAGVSVLTIDDIEADPVRCGLKGSPTMVRSSYTPCAKKNCVLVQDVNELIVILVKALKKKRESLPLPRGGSATGAGRDFSANTWAWLENPSETEIIRHGRHVANLLKTGLTAVMLGHEIENAAQALHGADRVIFIDSPALAEYNTELFTAAMQRLVQMYKPDTLLFGSSCNGRDFAPRLACRLQTGLTADCTGLDVNTQTGHVQWIRPAFGGNLMAVIECRTRPQMGTVRLGGNIAQSITACAPEIIREQIELPQPRARLIERHEETYSGDSLVKAEIIAAGGRGMGSQFALIHNLAQALGGSAAASRAAADAGWLPHTHQVGQTGRMVGPRLYIACGISGAAQHLAGIAGAETVVAINSDLEAPIFRHADYGIVGDVREVIPALIEELKRKSP